MTERTIRLDEVREILARLMDKREYMGRGPCMVQDADGWHEPPELPPDEGLRLSDFTDALDSLPDPAPESAIAEAIKAVFIQRGHFHLLGELAELCDEQWPDPADSGTPEDAAPALRCQVCSGPLPAGSKATRRTCSAACRQALMRIRRRG